MIDKAKDSFISPGMTTISIIIPVLNEAEIIQKTLLRLKTKSEIEVIVVDGGSEDRTFELTQELAQELKLKAISCPQSGRAHQMNRGAALATGDILLFLHADTQLPSRYPDIVKETLSQSQTIAGAFELAIEGPTYSLRFIEKMVNWRSRLLSLPYGDQAIFLKASVFQEIGGFADLPIMEDFELIQRLKKRGKIIIAPAQVLTSGRRWQTLGILKTTLINQLVIIGYYLRIPPIKLAHFYGRK
jgi:rSAM/selenodomain-associated transferase 2